MSGTDVETVARALLYEGHALYPYRASALKNQRRFPLSALAPRAFAEAVGGSERWRIRAATLVEGDDDAPLDVELRFLRAGDRPLYGREERTPLPRTSCRALSKAALRLDAEAAARTEAGVDYEALTYRIEARAVRLERAVHRLEIEVRNTVTVALTGDAARGRPDGPTREQMARRSLGSTHLVLRLSPPAEGRTESARFVSLLEPPDALAELVAGCENDGVHPVLVGAAGARDTVLASPVLVYDYPQIASETEGDYFDATEIDAMLALRVDTLTEAEKAEIRSAGGEAAGVLARAEALGARIEPLLRGRLARDEHEVVEVRDRRGAPLAVGDAVRLHPRGRADVMDLALRERAATVRSIEHEVDGGHLVTVTVDDDPGQDLGEAGWPGHLFFFRPAELERRE